MEKMFNIGDRVVFYECGFWNKGVVTDISKNFVDQTLIHVKDEFDSDLVFYKHEVKHVNDIDSFTGDYFFLSNFYESPVTIDGITYANSEAAFHSYKCPERQREFTILSPKDAKRLGRTVPLRPDWDEIRNHVMYNVCLMKFTQNIELTEKLLATDMDILIEGNTWHDTYWGVCDGVGENNLGKILMAVRDSIRSNNYKLRDIPEVPKV